MAKAKAKAKARSATGSVRKAKPARAGSTRGVATYQTLEVEIRDMIALVTLARPDVHNAFNETLIAELTSALDAVDTDDRVRAVIILGQGRSFCAGADLNWMKRTAAYDPARNLADAMALGTMLKTLNGLSKPTIARVHGAAFGGGIGLIACCDIAIAAQDATFALSETKLGLIPAAISPYVIEAIGTRQARRYFLTAERFSAAEAFRIGLIHDLVTEPELDARINELLGALLVAGPKAQTAAKHLIRAVGQRPIVDAVIADTAERIAAVRASKEGKEGVAAFLEKRLPAWVPDGPERS